MPKVSGIFDRFDHLDQIPISDIADWLNPRPDIKFLDNYIANRIIYPQITAISQAELDIDLAILREALKRNPIFFKKAQKKILIPEEFLSRLPDLNKLAWAFIDAYTPDEQMVFTMVGKGGDEVLGTYLRAEFPQESGYIELEIQDQSFRIKPGLTFIPCQNHCHINFKSSNGKILGKSELTIEVFGGRLGLAIDGRKS